jgi:hypothetical protein
MGDIVDPKTIGSALDMVSRRDFIKGVIASGAAASSAEYLSLTKTPCSHAAVVILRWKRKVQATSVT